MRSAHGPGRGGPAPRSDGGDGPGTAGAPAPPRLVDLHAHYVPGVDDGAPTEEDALAYLRQGFEEGVVRVAATPHLPASHADHPYRRRAEDAFLRLRDSAEEQLADLELRLAWEIRLDGAPVDVEDEGLWLGPGGHVLVEYDHFRLPADPLGPLRRLLEAGLTPVLAHPERYGGAAESGDWPARLREAGVLLCLNAGSLLGGHGPMAAEVAREMLSAGQADLVASDHHARPARSDDLPAVRARLAGLGREDAARTLLWRNPGAALDGGEMEEPPVVELPELSGSVGSRRTGIVRGGAG